MIARLILWSGRNRFLVLLAAALVCVWGVYAASRTPVDAIPDLSDTQVIIRTSWPGQAPQIVEDQVTYPLTTTMLSVPGVRNVRGYSFFGDSFVYVIFDDSTELYWARSRVLEYLNQAASRLPQNARPALGPDATGVGWIFEYALVDRTNQHDLGQLRALQDWFLQFELKTIPGVAEVASVGGMVRQFQVQIDPEKLRAYSLPLSAVVEAIQASNSETGGAVLELGEAEYMVRAHGYLQTLEDFRHIALSATGEGTPILLSDVANIQVGPEMRRGITELNGEGEVAGGIIVLRSGENARRVIDAVKQKLTSLQSSLPQGVEVVPVYDRSQLIDRAVDTLWTRLVEEFIVVAIVCALFLWHLRSALVAVVALPLGVLTAFIVMHYQGINANIMSLGGIAIAIGAMVDSMSEAQGYLMPVLLAILLPITFLLQAILAGKEGLIVQVLTWVPLWTPFAVLARLGMGIETWVLFGTGILLAASIAIELVFIGRLFRASLLATGQKPSMKRLIARLNTSKQ